MIFFELGKKKTPLFPKKTVRGVWGTEYHAIILIKFFEFVLKKQGVRGKTTHSCALKKKNADENNRNEKEKCPINMLF
jgi:hypothetical protein